MSEQINIRKMPKGIQSFEKIRRDGYVYVDKTDLVWQIANGDQNNFLSRPRRFGKSLLTSTLKCYFEGKRELFEGLKIMKLEKNWKPRQVFHFDFSGCNTSNELRNYLDSALGRYEKEYGHEATDKELKDRFLTLMMKGTEKYNTPVAVLVDEYDTPLQHTLYNENEHKGVRNIYTSFFPALKTGEDYVQCVFLTGITRFTQLSIFSTLNNISILGSWTQYATVCGITEEEIISNFMPELETISKENNWIINQTLDKLKEMYDGYHFSKDLSKGVYNPYSLVNALGNKDIANYWASSGGSTLLNDMLIHSNVNGDTLDNCTISKDTLERADVSPDNIPLFLYQAGYLTIKDANPRRYTLGIPNKEVRTALYEIVLPNALRKESGYVDNVIGNIQEALDNLHIESAMEYLKQLIAAVPFAHDSKEYLTEERYRYLLKLAFYIVGCRIEEEKQMATGQIDLVAHYDNCILVMELKLDSNGGIEAAKQQLIDRNYASAFSAEKKEVYAIAISFSTKDRSITNFAILKV